MSGSSAPNESSAHGDVGRWSLRVRMTAVYIPPARTAGAGAPTKTTNRAVAATAATSARRTPTPASSSASATASASTATCRPDTESM